MVKKFFSFVVLIILMLCICACENKMKKSESKDNINFSKYTGVVSNEEIARQIADNVFINSLKKNLDEYKIIKVTFEERNDVWRIVYMIDEFTVGGDITIKISRKNGEIIDIFYGE